MTGAPQRSILLGACSEKLTRMERAQIAAIRRTFDAPALNRVIRFCQRHIGATWIHHCTKHLRHVYGLERLPPLDRSQSFILIANHRSFFDLYVVTAELVRRGLPHRILFPVRANFFYDSALGFFVNGVMSFFAMYPPIFRERAKAAANVASLDELVAMLQQGGRLAGLHPEGTRKQDDDPYALLPAQRGIGRVIHEARVPVIPVFVNGLINDLKRQVGSNFDRSGRRVIVVFGPPVDFGDLLDRPGTPSVQRQIAERGLRAIAELGQEERSLRAELEGAAPKLGAGHPDHASATQS